MLYMYWLWPSMFTCQRQVCCSAAKSFRTPCYAMDCRTPGFPVLHYLPVCSNSCPLGRWCIQPSHPLSPPSPPVLNLKSGILKRMRTLRKINVNSHSLYLLHPHSCIRISHNFMKNLAQGHTTRDKVKSIRTGVGCSSYSPMYPHHPNSPYSLLALRERSGFISMPQSTDL